MSRIGGVCERVSLQTVKWDLMELDPVNSQRGNSRYVIGSDRDWSYTHAHPSNLVAPHMVFMSRLVQGQRCQLGAAVFVPPPPSLIW